MRNELLIIMGVALVAILHSAGVAVLPLPFSLISLPLVMVSWLALGLRFRTAALSAVLAGAVADLLAPTTFGIYALSALVAVVITALLLSRVLTHHTISALVGVNAAIFVLFHLVAFLFGSILRALSGGSLFHPATGYALLLVLMSLPLQLLVAVALRLLGGQVRGYTSRFILVK